MWCNDALITDFYTITGVLIASFHFVIRKEGSQFTRHISGCAKDITKVKLSR
jgi:hypothetical protein